MYIGILIYLYMYNCREVLSPCQITRFSLDHHFLYLVHVYANMEQFYPISLCKHIISYLPHTINDNRLHLSKYLTYGIPVYLLVYYRYFIETYCKKLTMYQYMYIQVLIIWII
jgi:hypothetical protein